MLLPVPPVFKLRPTLRINNDLAFRIREILAGLPRLTGKPIVVCAQPRLTAHRGKLLPEEAERGTAVYAACFIRKRKIILETELFSRAETLRVILVHEIFHFVWSRAANHIRNEFANLLATETEHGARGELGESSAVKKSLLLRDSGLRAHPTRWRDYVCESFCDTAAWLYSGVKEDETCKLAKRWKRRRRAWFESTFADGCTC